MSISDWSSDVCSADLLRSSRPCRRNPCIRGRGARPAPRSNPCGYISRAVAFAGGFPHAGEGKVALDAIPVAPCLEEVRIFDRATAIDGQPEGGVIDIPLIVKISRCALGKELVNRGRLFAHGGPPAIFGLLCHIEARRASIHDFLDEGGRVDGLMREGEVRVGAATAIAHR